MRGLRSMWRVSSMTALLVALAPRAEAGEPLDEADARRGGELYDAARRQYDEDALAAALATIDESLRLIDSPNSLLLRAHVLLGLGRRTEAMATYDRALQGSKRRLLAGESRFEATVAEAGRSMGVLSTSLAEVDIVVLGGGTATAAIDGGALPLEQREDGNYGARTWIEPREATVEASSGALRRARTLRFDAGTSRRVVLDLRPQAALPPTRSVDPPSYAPPVGAWIFAGVGVAGMATFATLGGLALAIDADLEATCSPDCPASRRADAAQGERYQIGADIAVAIGGASLATAAIWWIVDATGKSKATSAAPTATGAMLRF